MRYGKPIIASNVTSIPEIIGEAALYFSPFYHADIYRVLNMLNDNNYNYYASLSAQKFKEVHTRQEYDLNKLTNMILCKI